MLAHPLSYIGFGCTAFVICLTPFANVLFAGGIAYGAALLFEGFVDEGSMGPDGLPVPTNDHIDMKKKGRMVEMSTSERRHQHSSSGSGCCAGSSKQARRGRY